jgi:toxin FitB
VLDWFGRQGAGGLHLSAVGEAEWSHGAVIRPEGKRRERLIAEIDAMVSEDFAGRVLSFDSAAAKAFADIFAERRAPERSISFADCQIAAIARACGAAVATRYVGDFAGCGIQVIDPWQHPGDG